MVYIQTGIFILLMIGLLMGNLRELISSKLATAIL